MSHGSDSDQDPLVSYLPPQKPRAGRFFVAAAAIGLVTSGVLWWTLAAGQSANAATVAPPAKPTEAAPAVNDDPPPPPPPPAETTEPEKPAAPKRGAAKASSTSAPTNDCSSVCNGTASRQLQSAVRAKAGAARGCYERALRRNESLQGQMTVAMRVGSNGQVCGANVVNNGLGDPGVASCVVGLMRSGSLPAPTGGCVDLHIPLSFVGSH